MKQINALQELSQLYYWNYFVYSVGNMHEGNAYILEIDNKLPNFLTEWNRSYF